jgi:hypothetical protein
MSRRSPPGIWKYGDIEFHLSDDRKSVRAIFCHAFDRLGLGGAATFDRWFFEGHPSCEAVEKELKDARISLRREDAPDEPTGFLLRLDSGVELLFSTGANSMIWPGCAGLFGFQFARREAASEDADKMPRFTKIGR